MEKRKSLASGIISVVAIDLIIAVVSATAYISSHDLRLIIVGSAFICIADLIAILNVLIIEKEHARVTSIVTNALSENDITEVAPSEENEEAYIFEFLEDICSFYAMLTDEGEVKVIGYFQIEDKSEEKEYKVMSFEEFVKNFVVIN